jgi:hypothetical protein
MDAIWSWVSLMTASTTSPASATETRKDHPSVLGQLRGNPRYFQPSVPLPVEPRQGASRPPGRHRIAAAERNRAGEARNPRSRGKTRDGNRAGPAGDRKGPGGPISLCRNRCRRWSTARGDNFSKFALLVEKEHQIVMPDAAPDLVTELAPYSIRGTRKPRHPWTLDSGLPSVMTERGEIAFLRLLWIRNTDQLGEAHGDEAIPYVSDTFVSDQ